MSRKPACVSAHHYPYGTVQRRMQATLADGSRWQHGYNDRDEVTSGKRTWSDWTPVAGQQFEYAYDNIGNRSSSKAGGDANGASLRSAAYTANALNQYTSITNAPYQPIIGAALATNCVTVNGSTNGVTRRCEYFHREITVTNGNGAVWTGVTVDSGGTSTNEGSAQPAAQQSLSYDEDGNLKSDGTWAYRWDGENRLVEMCMTNIAYVPAAQRKKLEFVYDFMGRRVQKLVSAWNDNSSFTNCFTNRFLYDGWNLIAILDSQSSILQSFLWGQDLSGTMQGAGGIGGLLAIGDQQSGLTSFAAYDGNGNVSALVGRDCSVTARYAYGPFGEPIRVTGVAASVNPFCWSTKFADEESGLVYYGYRYYHPAFGRWLSRDPIGQQLSGLYGFARNSPIILYDTDGRVVPIAILVGVGIGMATGAAVGAWTNPDDPLYGAFIGGLIGGIGSGAGIIAAGITYGASISGLMIGAATSGATGQFLTYASQNFLGGEGPLSALSMSSGQLGGIVAAATISAFAGAVVVGAAVKLGAIDKIDDIALDAMVALAGSVGVVSRKRKRVSSYD